MKFGVSSAWLVGECSKCKEPSTGEYIADDYKFILRCVSCGHLDSYKVDEYGDNYLELELE